MREAETVRPEPPPFPLAAVALWRLMFAADTDRPQKQSSLIDHLNIAVPLRDRFDRFRQGRAGDRSAILIQAWNEARCPRAIGIVIGPELRLQQSLLRIDPRD